MATAQAQDLSNLPKMSYEEFLDWCDEDTLAEWVDGEVRLMSPASYSHQVVADFLVRILGIYVEHHALGQIISAPFQMKTGKRLPGREPDLIFIAQAHLSRIKGTYIDGPADLAVEIVSPESHQRDRVDKLTEYEQGGVQEYWILDPNEQRADFYVLADNGKYIHQQVDNQGIYRSTAIAGLWLNESWLWHTPPTLSVLRELGVL